MAGDTYSIEPWLIFTTLAVAAVTKVVFGAYVRWRKTQQFQLVGRLSALNVFPIKSCGGFSVESANCTKLGLRVHGITDRHWIVVKPGGSFLTARQVPKMVLVKISSHDNNIHIDAPGMSTLVLPKHTPLIRSKVTDCRVWTAILEGQDCGDDAAKWFSTFLEMDGLRLLYSADGLKKRRTWEEVKKWEHFSLPGDQAAFSDFAAYMILSEDSLAAVNEKLRTPVSIMNFRPNIVVKSSQPFEEDTWQEIRIGESVYFRMLDPCTRCVLTTVNPEKGIKDVNREPLATLKSFRCAPPYGLSPMFGVNAAVDIGGIVKIGDPVYALRK